MNTYVIEHRQIVSGKHELPLIAVVAKIRASSAREAADLARARYSLSTDEEILHIRRAA